MRGRCLSSSSLSVLVLDLVNLKVDSSPRSVLNLEVRTPGTPQRLKLVNLKKLENSSLSPRVHDTTTTTCTSQGLGPFL